MKLSLTLFLAVALLAFKFDVYAQAKTAKSSPLTRPSYILSSDWKDADAMTNVGISFRESQNYSRALLCFRRATELDSENAFYLGLAYKRGEGVSPNLNKAIHWYKRAADAGDVASLNNLGKIYQEKKDDALAFMYYKKAGEKGSATAMLNTAIYYEWGGVETMPPNKPEALRWYKKVVQGLSEKKELDAEDTDTYNKAKAAIARLEK